MTNSSLVGCSTGRAAAQPTECRSLYMQGLGNLPAPDPPSDRRFEQPDALVLPSDSSWVCPVGSWEDTFTDQLREDIGEEH